MNDAPTDIRQQLDYVKKQAQVIAEIHDLLQLGSFQGQHAQKLVMGQAYMSGLYQTVNAEVKRMEERLAEDMAPTFTEAVKTEIATAAKE